MYEDNKDSGLAILGLNYMDNAEHARRFLEKNKVTFPSVLDTSQAAEDVMWKYETLTGLTAFPMSYIIDKEGKVADAWYGIHDEDKVRKVLRRLF